MEIILSIDPAKERTFEKLAKSLGLTYTRNRIKNGLSEYVVQVFDTVDAIHVMLFYFGPKGRL